MEKGWDIPTVMSTLSELRSLIFCVSAMATVVDESSWIDADEVMVCM